MNYLHFTTLCPAFCLLLTALTLPIRAGLLNSYHKQMFGPIRKGKSGPSVQERLMGVLKDSCFHQLGEPEVNGDRHEELIPSPVTALPLSHLSYSTPLSPLVCEFFPPALSFISNICCVRVKVGTKCFGCFFFLSFPSFFFVFLNSSLGLSERGFYLSFCIDVPSFLEEGDYR